MSTTTDFTNPELDHLDTLVKGLRKFATKLAEKPDDIFLRAELVTDLDRAERASAVMLDAVWAMRASLSTGETA